MELFDTFVIDYISLIFDHYDEIKGFHIAFFDSITLFYRTSLIRSTDISISSRKKSQ